MWHFTKESNVYSKRPPIEKTAVFCYTFIGKKAKQKGEIFIKRILLDAGHYANYNQSPVVAEYWESRRMWTLCEFLYEELLKYGFFVEKTRSDPEKNLPVVSRGKKAKGFDLFISLHSNAASSEKVDRASVYAPYDNINSSHTLASFLAESIASIMEVGEGRVKTRKSNKGDWEYYGVMRGARDVGCPLYYIIEHSFHTNKKSALWLMSDSNLRRLARLEASVIAGYFGVFQKGDVDMDGVFDSNDLLILKSIVMGAYHPDEEQKQLADLDQNGEVDVFDYLRAKNEYMK